MLWLAGAVGLVGYLSLRNGARAVQDLASQLRSEISACIQGQLQGYLGDPHAINRLNATAFANGDLDIERVRYGEHLIVSTNENLSLDRIYLLWECAIGGVFWHLAIVQYWRAHPVVQQYWQQFSAQVLQPRRAWLSSTLANSSQQALRLPRAPLVYRSPQCRRPNLDGCLPGLCDRTS